MQLSIIAVLSFISCVFRAVIKVTYLLTYSQVTSLHLVYIGCHDVLSCTCSSLLGTAVLQRPCA